MASRATAGTHDHINGGELGAEVRSFVQALKRKRLSPNTIAKYETALRQLGVFLTSCGYPTDVGQIEARHIEAWTSELIERESPAIAHSRFRGAQRFFNWYADANDSCVSPMRRMRPPDLPQYARVLRPDQQQELLRTCQGTTFEDWRDMALLRVFFDAGARRAEVANLRYSPSDRAERDVDLDRGTLRIVDKEGRERIVSMGHDTLAAMRDYMRARRDHVHAERPWLWLGRNGRLDDSALGRALRDRGLLARIPDLHRLGHGLWVAPRGEAP